MKMFTIEHGSALYGLKTPSSDTDFKSVYVPTHRQIVLGKFPSVIDVDAREKKAGEKNVSTDVDNQIYSLHLFFHMLTKGEMISIDMLHAPHATSQEPIMLDMFHRIQEHRHLFYCSNMASFLGYIKTQAAKYGIKGSRLAFAKQLNEIVKDLPKVKTDKIRDLLLESEFAVKTDDCYELFGSRYMWTGWSTEVQLKLTKMINEYGARAQAAERNEGVDWKALHHALRSAYQVGDIFREQNIVFPFEGERKELLMKIKTGQLPYVQVAELIEEEVLAVEQAKATTTLPAQVDQEAIDDLLYELVLEFGDMK